MAPKTPGPRGFTIQEVRALSIEKRTFHLTWVVALLAATMSFVALQWVGVESGMHNWIAPLLPLSIDGLGIICSFGIIRSAGAKQPFKHRASEWMGLGLSLVLSMLGNGAHALGHVPPWLKIVYAVAVPGIVAYSIHVLGRYMDSGVSAHVLADDPDRVHFDLAQVGDPGPAPARASKPAPRVQTSTPARAAGTPTPAQPARAPRPVAARTTARPDDERARARALFDEAVQADPTSKPDAAAIRRDAGVERDGATVRRWVQGWWEEVQAMLGETRDPILEQVTSAESRDRTQATA